MNYKLETRVYQWLRQLRVPVSSKYLAQQLRSHTDYPSLLSVTGILDQLGIDNAAVVVDKERLDEIPAPFLAHGNMQGGGFMIVDNLDRFKNNEAFYKNWNGVIVVAEKAEQLKSKEAVVIVQHELCINNEITERLCAVSNQTDYNAVLNSKGSKLFGWFSWADAGIIYFSSLSLALLVSLFTGGGNSINTFTVLAVCSLPFTLFSVLYQWRVVKKWCTLCLLTVTTLWLQFAPCTMNLDSKRGQ